MKKISGITLVELLIAGAILGVLLAALTGLFSGSSKALKTNKEASERQQNATVAEQILKYELGLAGYRGVGNDFDDNTFDGNTLTIARSTNAATPDTLQVQYYEDRLYGEGADDVLMDVTFDIAEDEDGISYLTRQVGGTEAENLVEGVTNLKVLHYISYDDGTVDADETIPPDLAGLELELSFSNDTTKTVIISFQNPQTAAQTTQTTSSTQSSIQ